MDPTLWYILKIYYDSSQGTIDLDGGDLFPITVGVKQGGILSPALFKEYIDELIHNCTNANVGAIFNKINVSITVYADDILLLSPVDSHLQILLNICNDYSNLWRINFNAAKSNIVELDHNFTKINILY